MTLRTCTSPPQSAERLERRYELDPAHGGDANVVAVRRARRRLDARRPRARAAGSDRPRPRGVGRRPAPARPPAGSPLGSTPDGRRRDRARRRTAGVRRSGQGRQFMLDLANDAQVPPWVLVGGLMVELHTYEHGVVPVRVTDNADVFVDLCSLTPPAPSGSLRRCRPLRPVFRHARVRRGGPSLPRRRPGRRCARTPPPRPAHDDAHRATRAHRSGAGGSPSAARGRTSRCLLRRARVGGAPPQAGRGDHRQRARTPWTPVASGSGTSTTLHCSPAWSLTRWPSPGG
jgi:hypothetical protein